MVETKLSGTAIMKLLLYAGEHPERKRLEDRIHGLVSKPDLERYRMLDIFARRLCQPVTEASMAIILAGCSEELSGILALGELLSGMKIILILPDRKSATIAAAFKLYPRYVSYTDGDFMDVLQVAARMLKRADTTRCRYEPVN